MRKKSKSMASILMAAVMMSSLCSVPAAAEDFDAQETLEAVPFEDAESQEDTDLNTEAEAGEISVFDEETEEEELPVENEVESDAAGDEQEEFTDTADAGNPTYYELSVKIAGKFIGVSSENKDDILGDLDGEARSVVYDPEQNRLTLDNADIEGIITAAKSDMVIELKGENKISGEITSYCSFCALVFKGDGKLKISDGSDSFINAYGGLIIDGAELDFSMTDEKEISKPGILVNGFIEIKNKAEVHLKTQEVCIADWKNPPDKVDLKGITVSDSKLVLESENGRAIDIENSVTIQEGSDLKLTGGIYVSDQQNGTALNIKNSKINLTANESNGSGYGLYADKIQISDNSDVTVRTNAADADNTEYVSALRSQTTLDIANSIIKTEGPGYSFDTLGDINISKSIVLADAARKEAGGYVTSIMAADDNGNYSAVNITDSWVDAAADIEGEKNAENSVVFENSEGKVTGNAVIPGNVEVPKNHKLTVSEPATLTVPSGLAIANNGAISADCTSLKGTVTGTAPVYTHAKLTQWVNDSTSHWKECVKCGAKMQKTSHTYGAWKTLKAAGLGVSGAREHYCTTCNFAQGEDLAAIQVMQLQVKGAKKAVSLKWSKVSGADGYMIYGAKCGSKTRLIKTVGKKTSSWKQKKLKAGTYYKYYVAAYKMVSGKKVIIGQSSDMHVATNGKGYGYAKKITVNKASLKLKAGKTAKIKATVTNTSKKVKDHTSRVRYISTNRDIATVNSKGKVTAKAKGTCYIYCYGLNGLTKKVKITVK